jgi:hypothetical protein
VSIVDNREAVGLGTHTSIYVLYCVLVVIHCASVAMSFGLCVRDSDCGKVEKVVSM